MTSPERASGGSGRVRTTLESLLPGTLDFLQRLVSENSSTFNPVGVGRNADLIAAQFSSLGFSAERVPSVDARFGEHLFLSRPGRASAPGLLLVSHLDTVFSPEEERQNAFFWQPEGDRIYGPGVIDIKGGTAMIWLVLSALRALDSALFDATPWVIAVNAAEEELLPDFAEEAVKRLPAVCRAALIFESCGGLTEDYSLVRGRKGSVNLRIRTTGRGAHAGSRHEQGANALVALAEIMTRVSRLTDYARKLTVNIGWAEGGGPINRVPHSAACEINMRAFDPALLDDAVQDIRDIAAETLVRAASDGFPVQGSVEILSRNPAWPPSSATDALIDRWQAAARDVGVVLRAEERGGLSDGNFLSLHLPVLDGLGPFGRNGHASERSADGSKVPEYVLPNSYLDVGAVNLLAIRQLLTDDAPAS